MRMLEQYVIVDYGEQKYGLINFEKTNFSILGFFTYFIYFLNGKNLHFVLKKLFDTFAI